jgi:hypothetical protein
MQQLSRVLHNTLHENWLQILRRRNGAAPPKSRLTPSYLVENEIVEATKLPETTSTLRVDTYRL